MKTVEKYAFFQCENLKSITFSEGLEKIEVYAFWGNGCESLEFPASLRMVAQAAFAKCKSLKTVKFSDGLEVLGTDEYPDNGRAYYGTFDGSGLEHIELPSSLKRIEYSAF